MANLHNNNGTFAAIKSITSNVAIVTVLGLVGCAEESTGTLGSHTLESFSQNSFSQNSFSQNSFSQNSFSQNALSDGLMPDGRLSLDTDGLDMSSAEVREVAKYLARCALAPEDVLVATVDGIEYEFPGLLSVAPEWKDEALTPESEEAMTACLMAHVNDFAIPVHISLRGIGQSVTEEEIARFPWNEGTFFGNVFADAPTKYACSGDDAPDFELGFPHPAGDRLLRRCIDVDEGDGTTTRCGFEYVGSCSDICDTYVDGNYTDCWVDGVQYSQTASTWLLAYDDSETTLTQDLHDQFYGN